MNLKSFASMYGRTGKGIVLDRIERIKREGSPVYIWTPGIIAAGATAVIETNNQFPASRKYAPLDSLEIVNNEAANDITLTINGGDNRYCPAGTIRSIAGRGVALWHIAITNNGGANTTAGNIVVSLQKAPLTMDRWIGEHG